MAANPPREGLVFVPGTAETVGTELLKHVDDPRDVIAYAGYGYWAPAAAVAKVDGAEEQKLTNAPIAPVTAPYVDDAEYEDIELTESGEAKGPGKTATEQSEADLAEDSDEDEKPKRKAPAKKASE